MNFADIRNKGRFWIFQ